MLTFVLWSLWFVAAGTGQLEQFLVLANSSRGLAAAELIKSVLKHATIFVFGELLDHPNIKGVCVFWKRIHKTCV